MVGAILGLPGVTWNAPGALALVNQLSSNPVRAAVGGAGSAGVSFLSSLLTLGVGGALVTALNQAVAATGSDAFVPIANFRGNWDPHSMVPIIQALEAR